MSRDCGHSPGGRFWKARRWHGVQRWTSSKNWPARVRLTGLERERNHYKDAGSDCAQSSSLPRESLSHRGPEPKCLQALHGSFMHLVCGRSSGLGLSITRWLSRPKSGQSKASALQPPGSGEVHFPGGGFQWRRKR